MTCKTENKYVQVIFANIESIYKSSYWELYNIWPSKFRNSLMMMDLIFNSNMLIHITIEN